MLHARGEAPAISLGAGSLTVLTHPCPPSFAAVQPAGPLVSDDCGSVVAGPVRLALAAGAVHVRSFLHFRGAAGHPSARRQALWAVAVVAQQEAAPAQAPATSELGS